ncbi:MAG UNVERIFIED_CONTAM: hypothetical protein LVR18_28625 [Planctomycetaceae bacterium]
MNSAALESFASRAAGRQERWTPSEQIRAAFQELPQEFGSVTVSDPAPAYRQLFTAAACRDARVEFTGASESESGAGSTFWSGRRARRGCGG